MGTATNLTHLYLQNNSIGKIEDFKTLHRLTKLYLGHNNLLVIEGLENLQMLKELHVEHQNLPVGEKLLFDPRTLFALSNSLHVLNVSGNRLDSFKTLEVLMRLVEVQARSNQIEDLESISEALESWHNLRKLNLNENPINTTQKYRDEIIVRGPSLETLDGKEVGPTERQFLVRWKASRDAKRSRNSRGESDEFNGVDIRQKHHVQSAQAVIGYAPPTSNYMMKGLPGGRARFEAILAKSRSLPNSAMVHKSHHHTSAARIEQLNEQLRDHNGGSTPACNNSIDAGSAHHENDQAGEHASAVARDETGHGEADMAADVKKSATEAAEATTAMIRKSGFVGGRRLSAATQRRGSLATNLQLPPNHHQPLQHRRQQPPSLRAKSQQQRALARLALDA